ncbi:MAG TPA: Asp-tRNA(Asn)/Glu-tRNA(Gln) amidotransferase subunit GatB, partial [Anaerolineales bacterium]|nr:Asp-tRNA(Asn)/Glu-tRNA(Gln) amidotransferase subunit GatB [Anaerolineales bacterium]
MYEPVIGLEIHAQLLTRSKMFCACPVVDLTEAAPNSAVCEVCSGMPGTLPVVNEKAVEYALRVALALECEINPASVFARKNYFYPDLPKGFQISQYEEPLARTGRLTFRLDGADRTVRIRRVHLEEDTGKTTHVPAAAVPDEGENLADSPIRPFAYSLIDLNRAGVPLLEIVTEPDLGSPEEVGACARALRRLLQYLDVNTGDMQKGVLRIEPNVSVRPAGRTELGTRTEVKNLNSFRALERAVAFEIERQTGVLEAGGTVVQETVGWDEAAQAAFPQRGKEEAHDYRYFPEPDLPPLILAPDFIERVSAGLPERPHDRFLRYMAEYGLGEYDADVLTADREVADYFEAVAAQLAHSPALRAGEGEVEGASDPKTAANWITGELFALMNQAEDKIATIRVRPEDLAALLGLLAAGTVNAASAQKALAEMYRTGRQAAEVVEALGLAQ